MKAWWTRVWRAITTRPRPTPEPTPVHVGVMESFERAFSGRVSGPRGFCECGREFFDNYNTASYDWEDGELEALHDKPEATPLPYAVSRIEFEGASYVYDCPCWRPRAHRIAAFLVNHDAEIASFLSEERRRKQAAASTSPMVRA